MNTRAHTAAGSIAKAVQNVASTVGADNATAQPSAEPEQQPLATTGPLLLRLQHGVRFAHDDLQQLQPKIGASVVVADRFRDESKAAGTVWLSASAWQGIGTIIRQTPDWYRKEVAEFLKVLRVGISDSAIGGLLDEVIVEVETDPYTDVPESNANEFDFNW